MATTYEGTAQVQFMPGKRIVLEGMIPGVFLPNNQHHMGLGMATIEVDDTTVAISAYGHEWLLPQLDVVAIRGKNFGWTNPVVRAPRSTLRVQIPDM